jgi:hypothetical protein
MTTPAKRIRIAPLLAPDKVRCQQLWGENQRVPLMSTVRS